jgi:UDP-glucose 4-epimerase
MMIAVECQAAYTLLLREISLRLIMVVSQLGPSFFILAADHKSELGSAQGVEVPRRMTIAMDVLITGGAGFIGSHLADELLSRGHCVHILDNLSTGTIKNIDHLRAHERFSYTVGSVMEERLVAELVDRADHIYHLAAAVGVRLIVENPVGTLETNLKGTEIVLAAARHKKKKVLVTSTSEVYGKSDNVPFDEDQDLLIGPSNKARWSYACSKALDEFLAFAHARHYGLPVVIVRLFNTVGPRQTGRYGMVLPTLVGQAVAGEPLTVFGDGQQSRCFCHVRDVVKALVDLMDCDAALGQVVNVGNDRELSINELAAIIRERSATSSEISRIPYSEAYGEGFEDMRRRIPALDKLERLLGWRPRTSIERILDDVIAEHRQQNSR